MFKVGVIDFPSENEIRGVVYNYKHKKGKEKYVIICKFTYNIKSHCMKECSIASREHVTIVSQAFRDKDWNCDKYTVNDLQLSKNMQRLTQWRKFKNSKSQNSTNI